MPQSLILPLRRLGLIAVVVGAAACARTTTSTAGGDVAPQEVAPDTTLNARADTTTQRDSAAQRDTTVMPDTAASRPDSAAAPADTAVSRADTAAAVDVTSDTRLSAGNIAAVLAAANMDEVQTSQLALQRASDAKVKAYAERMVSEHQSLHQNMETLLRKKQVEPEDNATSQQMKATLARTVMELASRSGPEFDKAYVAHQVQAHQTTLQAIDRQLVPSATDAELKAMLRDQVRPRVAKHLSEAQQLQSALK